VLLAILHAFHAKETPLMTVLPALINTLMLYRLLMLKDHVTFVIQNAENAKEKLITASTDAVLQDSKKQARLLMNVY
jgi:hypothetical protein